MRLNDVSHIQTWCYTTHTHTRAYTRDRQADVIRPSTDTAEEPARKAGQPILSNMTNKTYLCIHPSLCASVCLLLSAGCRLRVSLARRLRGHLDSHSPTIPAAAPIAVGSSATRWLIHFDHRLGGEGEAVDLPPADGCDALVCVADVDDLALSGRVGEPPVGLELERHEALVHLLQLDHLSFEVVEQSICLCDGDVVFQDDVELNQEAGAEVVGANGVQLTPVCEAAVCQRNGTVVELRFCSVARQIPDLFLQCQDPVEADVGGDADGPAVVQPPQAPRRLSRHHNHQRKRIADGVVAMVVPE
mmetsp:Transcript_40291/g.114905  ORF Transcript_40291/g.114905 Transcript_40291/m.114905 type:complete len:303 (+) Transcript_40291:154-1062(+)